MKLIDNARTRTVVNLTDQEVIVDGCNVYNGLPENNSTPHRGRDCSQFDCDGLVIERTYEGFTAFTKYLSEMDVRYDIFIQEVYCIVDGELVAITDDIIELLADLSSELLPCLDHTKKSRRSRGRRGRRTFGVHETVRRIDEDSHR